MGYDASRTAKMLNVRCIICNRPLLNADSVQRAVGPDCAKKHGIELRLGFAEWEKAAQALADVLPPDHEIWPMWGDEDKLAQIANALTWWVAHADHYPRQRTAGICALDALGYTALARAAAKGRGGVFVKEQAGRLEVTAPYSETWVQASRSIYGRLWVAARKVTTFPADQRLRVWQAICNSYAGGTPVVGDRGIRAVP
jgi:hypothetical protein